MEVAKCTRSLCMYMYNEVPGLISIGYTANTRLHIRKSLLGLILKFLR